MIATDSELVGRRLHEGTAALPAAFPFAGHDVHPPIRPRSALPHATPRRTPSSLRTHCWKTRWSSSSPHATSSRPARTHSPGTRINWHPVRGTYEGQRYLSRHTTLTTGHLARSRSLWSAGTSAARALRKVTTIRRHSPGDRPAPIPWWGTCSPHLVVLRAHRRAGIRPFLTAGRWPLVDDPSGVLAVAEETEPALRADRGGSVVLVCRVGLRPAHASSMPRPRLRMARTPLRATIELATGDLMSRLTRSTPQWRDSWTSASSQSSYGQTVTCSCATWTSAHAPSTPSGSGGWGISNRIRAPSTRCPRPQSTRHGVLDRLPRKPPTRAPQQCPPPSEFGRTWASTGRAAPPPL